MVRFCLKKPNLIQTKINQNQTKEGHVYPSNSVFFYELSELSSFLLVDPTRRPLLDVYSGTLSSQLLQEMK
jgi:hypothetical protein